MYAVLELIKSLLFVVLKSPQDHEVVHNLLFVKTPYIGCPFFKFYSTPPPSPIDLFFLFCSHPLLNDPTTHDSLIYEHLLHWFYPFFSFLSNSPPFSYFFALFPWLIVWLGHTSRDNLLNHISFIIIDLHLSILSALVPEASCSMVYAWRHHVHCASVFTQMIWIGLKSLVHILTVHH